MIDEIFVLRTFQKSITVSFRNGDEVHQCSYVAPSVSFATIHEARKSVGFSKN